MALASTIYRFQINISDVDRGVYEALDLRIACHPSETISYLLTRVLAYALEIREDLVLGKGLAAPEEPALSAMNEIGGIGLWIEIGQPSAAKMHKICKQADEVRIYTHKDVELVLATLREQEIHKGEAIEIVAIPSSLLEPLEDNISRKNVWDLLRTEGTVYVTTADGDVFEGGLGFRSLA